MKDITKFINEELKPRTWDNIPTIFPEMGFKMINGKWCSNKHYDGKEATHPTQDKSVITPNYPYRVFDNARQDSKDIITLYMELNNISEVYEAVKQLCSIVGINVPEYTQEQKDYYQKSEQRRNLLEESLQRQRAALYTKEGFTTLEYLHKRKWTDEHIKAAELGFISVDEANKIQAQRTIGDKYILSIPLRSGGVIYGFKFRTIDPDIKDKYVYLHGTNKKENLFNLTGILQKNEDARIIVVEGELDALHAKVMGISGVVATSGGGLTDELLQAALNKGIKRITLLFDKDESGEKFVKKSIDTAWKKGISVLVATFPEEYLPDGTKIHDLDEYLQKHTAEEFETLIDNAQKACSWLFYKIIEDAEKNNGTKDNLRHDVADELERKVIKLMNETPSATDRDFIAYTYEQTTGGAITKESLIAVADEERARADKLQKKRLVTEASNKASVLLKDNLVDEALNVMKDTAKSVKQIETRQKHSYLLSLPTEKSLFERMKNKQRELPTLYEFEHPMTHEKERFTLSSGAIIFIVAPTSHGKSTILQNIALQIAKAEGEGTTLYFTFEEDGDSVTLQLINKYIGEELCKNYSSSHSNNIRAITHYFRTGEDKYISTDKRSVFNQKIANFINSLYQSGKLKIFYEDYDSTELIDAIRYICSQTKVKAVFIDYIQLLSKNGNRKQRTEELKDICKDLKDLCIETQLPIVVAAQANREVTSPLEMHSQKIAEAADLERIANKVLFIWNSSFEPQKSKDSKAELEKFENRTGIKLGTSGKIYAKLTKNRGGIVGIEAILNYNGNTGIVEPNYKPTEYLQSNESIIPF